MHKILSRSLPLFAASLMVLGALSANAYASTAGKATFVDAAAEQAIRDAFQRSRPDLQIDVVAPSEMPGVYRVEMKNGPTVYSSASGQYFIAGDLYELSANGIENVAEKRLQPMRKELLAQVAREDMIIFSPKGETKGALYVFTDVDCGFCQKLHREVPALNAQGIEVRYLAYPRQGVGTPTFNKMVSAWCADDRLAAMDALKARQSLPAKQCETPIIQQFELGQRLGVTGTPAIITETGMLIPGYRPADQLIPLASR
ncbi:DsbC family protein [Spongiibacter sp.]|uniref:DsbC family protein n=1 Tax=Spongiibacter sp. TaxID=2024860 RepID=UPI003562AE3F